MSVTDNAFIKAYRREACQHEVRSESPAKPHPVATRVVTDLSGATSARLTTLVEHVDGAGSSFVTSAGHATLHGPHPLPNSKPSAAAPTASAADVVWRPERAEGTLKGPHRWASSVPPSSVPPSSIPPSPVPPSAAGSQPNTGTAESLFEAKWEVDRFELPPICQQLQERCAPQLTDVIRGVLQSAWQGKNMLAITAFDQREGGTTLAITLGHLASCFDINVALVDGNTHHPELGKTLGLAPLQGWESYGPEQPLEEVAIQVTGSSLVVLPYANGQTDSPAAAGQSADLIRELTGRFDLVVIDTGPMFAAAHTWFAEPAVAGVHGAIVVRDIRNTEDVQLHDVLHRLDRVGIANVGIIENFIG